MRDCLSSWCLVAKSLKGDYPHLVNLLLYTNKLFMLKIYLSRNSLWFPIILSYFVGQRVMYDGIPFILHRKNASMLFQCSCLRMNCDV